MRRRRSAVVDARNAAVLQRIEELKSEHPFWGYRRVWATLRFTDKITINPKRVLRLMREHALTVKSRDNLKATRTPSRPKPRPSRPQQWWGIDMTKVMTANGWAYVVVVLDWYTKKIVGHYVGDRCLSRHWLAALDQAVNRQFPDGVRDQGLHVMSDNGCQPTSVAFMKACGQIGVRQAFTSYNNPKGNADTERMIRTLKEECTWLREWASVAELSRALTAWFERYNMEYLHSALGYKTPQQVETEWMIGAKTLLDAA